MAIRDEVNQAWSANNRPQLRKLMRTANDDWQADALVFLDESIELEIDSGELFLLAKEVYDGLIPDSWPAREWRSFIFTHLLNLDDRSDYAKLELAVAATGGNLPSDAWNQAKPWIQEWVEWRLDFYDEQFFVEATQTFVIDESKDSWGFFQPRFGNEDAHLPVLFHPIVLRLLAELLEPADDFAYALAQWLQEKAIAAPSQDISIHSTFVAVATLCKVAGLTANGNVDALDGRWRDLANQALNVLETYATFGDDAPQHWHGGEAVLETLLAESPLWHDPAVHEWPESAIHAGLRRRAHARLRRLFDTLIEEFARNSDKMSLAIFTSPLAEIARLPLPQYRATDRRIGFWADPSFADLEAALNAVTSLGQKTYPVLAKDDERTDTRLIREISRSSQAVRLALEALVEKPICRLVLPSAASLAYGRGDAIFAVRSFLRSQLQAIPLQTGHFGFGLASDPTAGFATDLANTAEWHTVVHASAPLGDSTATLESWSPLSLWDGLRARLISKNLPSHERAAIDELWQQIHDHTLFKLLQVEVPNLDLLPIDEPLEPLRAQLALLVHLGHPDWKTLAREFDGFLAALKGQSKDQEYQLFAAARLELGMTALAAEHAPGEAIPSAKDGPFALLQELVDAAMASTFSWESRAGMNGQLWLARLAESTGDPYAAEAVTGGMGQRAVKLVRDSVVALTAGEVLPGSDLPLAFAAADLSRYTRERGAGIANQLNPAPAWHAEENIDALVDTLAAAAVDQAISTVIARSGDLSTRRLLLAVLQIKAAQSERDRRLLVRPLREVETDDGVVGLGELRRLRDGVAARLCAEAVLLTGVYDDHAPWRSPAFWFRTALADDTLLVDEESDEPLAEPQFSLFDWADTWHGPAAVDLLGRAAWLSTRVPKGRIAGDSFKDAEGDSWKMATDYSGAIYMAALERDIDGRYPGEIPYRAYGDAKADLDARIGELKTAHTDYMDALAQQKEDVKSQRLDNLLSAPLRLNTADFRQQIQAALAEVREAEALLEVAEHESLAVEFEVLAGELLTAAAQIEVDREKAQAEVTSIQSEINLIQESIAKLNLTEGEHNEQLAVNQETAARLTLQQTQLRQDQAQKQYTAIDQEITFIRKALEEQIPAVAQRTEEVLKQQFERQILEATQARDAAKKKEKKARKKAKRNALIKSACKFVGSVVGFIYGGGPAGAALGAQIGEAVAELTIGIMEDRPPGDILVGLIDNAFAIADTAGYDLEGELNSLGGKAAGEITEYLADFKSTFEPLLQQMPDVINQEMFQDALELLGLEELNEVSGLAQKFYAGLGEDAENLGQIGTILSEATGKGSKQLESVGELTGVLKDTLFKETNANYQAFADLAERVGVQVDRLISDETEQQRVIAELGEIVTENASQFLTGAIAKQATDFRTSAIQGWVTAKRSFNDGAGQFWDDPVVQEEAKTLLKHLYPADAETRAIAEANLADALLSPEVMRGKVKKHLSEWQLGLDQQIKRILENPDNPKPSAKKESEFWQQQIRHLTTAQAQFEGELFPWMRGESIGPGEHPRDVLINRLNAEKEAAESQLQAIKDLEIQRHLDELNIDNAAEKLAIAKVQLEEAAAYVESAQLVVQQDNIRETIAALSIGRAENLAAAEEKMASAAKARAAAAQAKIRAASENLAGNEALLNGARRMGLEAGRIRTMLDQPPLALDLAGLQAKDARKRYEIALQEALFAYRELLRYLLTTFFIDDGKAGDVPMPRLERPDLATAAGSWHEALTRWQTALDDSLTDQVKAGIVIDSDVFFWDLTPQQVAAITGPTGLKLHVGPQVVEEERLFTIPADMVKPGKLTQAAMSLFAEHGHPLSLFSMDLRFGKLLDSGQLSEPLLDTFKYHRHRLNDPVVVEKVPGKRWVIGEPTQRATIRHEGGNQTVVRNADDDALLFSLSKQLAEELADGPPSEGLRDAFAASGYPLEGEATLVADVLGNEWRVIETIPVYTVVNENRALNVYGPEIGAETAFIDEGSYWRVLDETAPPVHIQLHNMAGQPVEDIEVIEGEPRAFLIRPTDGEVWDVARWTSSYRYQVQSPKTGRSLPASRHLQHVDTSHARTGRMVAIFVRVLDEGQGDKAQALTQTNDYDLEVQFLGNHWPDKKHVQLYRAQSLTPRIEEDKLDPRRIVEAPQLETTNAEHMSESKLKALAKDSRKSFDNDAELDIRQGTPLAGTTLLRLVAKSQMDSGKTIGAVSVIVLYKHYSR